MRLRRVILVMFILPMLLMTSCMEMGMFDEMPSQRIEIKEIDPGTKVEVIAEPRPGFEFSHWSIDGEIVSQKEVYTFNMPKRDIALVANFSRR